MQIKYISFVLLALLIGCNNSIEIEDTSSIQEEIHATTRSNTIIFEDNFEQSSNIPDTSKWVLCPQDSPAWAKYLSESYEQAYVQDGKLVLVAEKMSGNYKAGGLQTLGKFDFQYGKVEVNARFTKPAQGGWPAIWMMPSAPKYSGGWPACGEIDIMEQLNHEAIVHHTIHSHYKNTLHLYIPLPSMISFYNKNEFNTYAVEWTPDYLLFSVNGHNKLRYPNWRLSDEATKKQWPFDAPFYIILNYALGGEGTWPGAIRDSDLPAKMEIDWVKVSR